MTRNSRELSQFASFVEVTDANQNIGINTSLIMLGGVGIGSGVNAYLNEVANRGSEDPLINFNETYLLDDVYLEGDIFATGTGITFANVNVSGLTTTKNLVVTGVSTLSRDTGMGTVYVGQTETPVSRGRNGISTYLVVIDTDNSPLSNELSLEVFGKSKFNGESVAGYNTLQTFDDVPIGFEVQTNAGFGTDVIINAPLTVYSNRAGADNRGPSRFIASENVLDLDSDAPQARLPAVEISGGLLVEEGYTRLGAGLSVGYGLVVGSGLNASMQTPSGGEVENHVYNSIDFESPTFTIGITSTSPFASITPLNRTEINLRDSYFVSNLLVTSLEDVAPGIGTSAARWHNAFLENLDVGSFQNESSYARMVNLDVSGFTTMSYAKVAGAGGTDNDEVVFQVGPGKVEVEYLDSVGRFNHLGIATINGFLNVITEGGFNNAFVATAFQANNVDLYKVDQTNTIDPEFFYPAMANSGLAQTDAGGELYVNPGFYLDAFGTSLFVHNNLNVLGTSINATEEFPELTFDLLNYGVHALKIGSDAVWVDIGQGDNDGITSIRSGLTQVTRLQVTENDIRSGTGVTVIRFNNADTIFNGNITVGGTSIFAGSNVFSIAPEPQRGDIYKSAEDVVIGANDLGIATIRNNITELIGFLRLGKNVIQSDDGATAIQVGTSGTYAEFPGDIIVGGNDIQTGFGQTNITMVDVSKTIFAGDIQVGGNNILSSDGNINITMFDGQELTSVTGDLRVEGNTIQAGTGDTNITLQSNQNTIFAGAIQVGGDAIRASNGQENILMDSDLKTTVTGDLQVGTGTMRAGDGTISIAMEGGTGNVAITSDVTANSAFFNGLEARLNVQDVDIRDNLLRIGLIEDPTTQGNLIPPNVGLGNSGDVGIVMARYDVGLSTHKYAAIYYDNSEGRVAIRTDVTDAGLGAGRDRYLLNNGLPSELEVRNLYVNFNTNLGIKTIFEAGNVVTGEETKEVLNVVNVEIDGGIFA